jgi:hypothetical protein
VVGVSGHRVHSIVGDPGAQASDEGRPGPSW